MIADIARRVVRQLRDSGSPAVADASPATPPAAVTGEKLITIETLDRHAATGQVVAAVGAIITPAAREEALRRGITIQSAVDGAMGPADCTSHHQTNGSSASIPESLRHQLDRRNVVLPAGVEIRWCDEPATEVYRCCSNGQRATMVAALSDVQRFHDELAPDVWVLDRQKLNLVAAVNVAARIARCAAKTVQPNDGGPR
ncbi:hypothetical protein Mal15_46780 [Stieleria maiorica]|uniref:Uncharacterized protein n=2 Tax=Stieleria maiorica TaxID=2795974 RepID=A0A5B9MKT5_9BACT|nr:hypothetical protein Mal15_46780 [Stieleria maiorica]